MKQEGAEASAVSYRRNDALTLSSPLGAIERLVAEVVGEVFHFGFGLHFKFGHDVLLCRAQLQKALRSKQAALRLMHNRMKAGGTAPPSAVSYSDAKRSAAKPLRPVERLVGQLVGEVFHFGFGRHYQFRHVVLL